MSIITKDDLIRDLCSLLRLISMVQRSVKMIYHLSRGEEDILSLLTEKNMSTKEIKKVLGVPGDSISHHLDKLQNYPKGDKIVSLIKRVKDRNDMRITLVSITSIGKKVLSENIKKREKKLGILLSQFDEKDLNDLPLFLEKMRKSLDGNSQINNMPIK